METRVVRDETSTLTHLGSRVLTNATQFTVQNFVPKCLVEVTTLPFNAKESTWVRLITLKMRSNLLGDIIRASKLESVLLINILHPQFAFFLKMKSNQTWTTLEWRRIPLKWRKRWVSLAVRSFILISLLAPCISLYSKPRIKITSLKNFWTRKPLIIITKVAKIVYV